MNLSVLSDRDLDWTPYVFALSPCVPASTWGWGVCKTYRQLTVVHWSKVLGSHGVIESCILNNVEWPAEILSILEEGPAQKTWTITTVDWLTLSSKSELCDGSLTTETSHNTIMLHWGRKKKKRNSDYKSQTMLSFFVYMQKCGPCVFKWQAIPKGSGCHLKSVTLDQLLIWVFYNNATSTYWATNTPGIHWHFAFKTKVKPKDAYLMICQCWNEMRNRDPVWFLQYTLPVKS